MENYYALIMAGGGGTRLYPLSRRNRPKQMLPLVGEESLFRVSVTRLAALFPPERIFVVAGRSQVAALQADVPELPAQNFIVEPFGRDSAPAAALGVQHIARINPAAVVAILTADHYIGDVDGFIAALRAAYAVALDDYIVTLGIKPAFAATGFGYIKQGDSITSAQHLTVYHSDGFKEKPDAATAQHFVDSGLYAWNSGMFIWQARQALAEFERQQPALFERLQGLVGVMGTPAYEQLWEQMPKISLDYAVMENAERMAMIPVDIGWNDIGSWAAVYDELSKEIGGNVAMHQTRHIEIDTAGTLINSERIVATIGVDDLVIIDTPDVLLVCQRDRAQDVKRIVEYMQQNNLEHYL